MLRKVILTTVFGLVAAGFAWYGLTQAQPAPAEGSQCLDKMGEAAKDAAEEFSEAAKDGLEKGDMLDKESDYGGGLLFEADADSQRHSMESHGQLCGAWLFLSPLFSSCRLVALAAKRQGEKCFIYHANESCPEGKEAANYDTIIGWLRSSQNAKHFARRR